MDFSKAFDKVSHKKLLYKLSKILKNSQLINWFTVYLEGREQFVVFNDHHSERLTVDSGVSQGSVPGPLLFLMFINDVLHGIPVTVKLYVNDCVLYSEIENTTDQELLNEALRQVVAWCEAWQMSTNFKKTVFMSITRKKHKLRFSYATGNIFLSEVTHYEYLRLWITNGLTWNKHLEYVVANANRKLFFLRRALKLSTPTVRLLAYKAVILPILDYACVIWDPFTKPSINKIEMVQRKAARFIYNSFGRTSVTELLTKANLLPITQRNRVSRLKFLFQLINGHYKTDLTGIITFSSGYATR